MSMINVMRRLIILITIFFISVTTSAEYALVADYVIDGKSDNPLKNRVILVSGKKIVSIIDVDAIPEKYTVINLPGTVLMPGMVNAHEHPLLYQSDYQNGHLQASSAFKALMGLKALQRLLESGWTSIRVMGDGDVYYANQDIRKAIDQGMFLGPRLTGAAHYISITGGGGDINFLSPEQHVTADGLIADGPHEIRKAIRQEIKFGSDSIKVMVMK